MGIGRLIDKFSSFLHENPWAFPAALLTAGTAASLGGAAVAWAAGAAEGGAGIAGSAAAAELAAPLASGGSLAGWSPLIEGVSTGSLLSAFGPEAGSLGASLMGGVEPTPFLTSVSGFAPGAATASPGVAGLFGPATTEAAGAAAGSWLTPKRAMALAQVLLSGSGSAQDRSIPQGSPLFGNNVSQSPGVMTQEQITKKWLLENDPNTYARIYGSPQPMGA